MGAMVRYICQFCGYQGEDPTEDDLDRVQCEACGEPAAERRA